MIKLTLVYLLWVLYCIYEGKREAYYYSFKIKALINTQQSSKITDEHTVFTIQRSFVVFMIIFSFFSNYYDSSILLLSLALTFPFLHDGAYYVARHNLDGIYNHGWFSQSATSTAVSDKLNLFNPIPRTIYFVLGIGLMLYNILSK